MTGQIVMSLLNKKKKCKKNYCLDRVEVWDMSLIWGQLYLRYLLYIQVDIPSEHLKILVLS